MKNLCNILFLIIFPISTLHSEQVEWASKVIAFSSQYSDKQRSALQVLGKPSVMTNFGITPCAWMPDINSKKTEEWIIVGFDKPINVEQIAVAENYNPGNIKRLYLIDSLGIEHFVFENISTPFTDNYGRMNSIQVERTNYRVHSLKLVMKQITKYEQYQIDAIAISDTKKEIRHSINLAPESNIKDKPQNLGLNVNSEYDELAPVISPDGKTLYFTRAEHPENIGDEKHEDIWVSKLNKNNSFEPAQNLGSPINNKFPNYALSITPDGNSLLLGNVYYVSNNDTLSKQGVSISYNKGDSWSFPEKLNIKNFYNHSRKGTYCLSNSGKVLILSIEREDSYGGLDLYVSFLESDNSWSEPKNLGATINTADDDFTPFLAADDKTLYFSTTGFCGFGNNDIFISRLLDSSWTNWSEPQNIGPVINSDGWDAYFTIPASGDYAYFVSTKNSYGAEDIFRIKLPESLKPKPVVLISGKVFNSDKDKPIDAIIKYETLPEGIELGIARTNPVTGEYKIVLPGGSKYGFHAEAKGFIAIDENIDLTETKKYTELLKDLYLVPIEKGKTIRLNNIFFEFGKFELLPESYAELNRVINFMKENPSIKIQINGHTDDVGSSQENLILSKRRAESVENYLSINGITKSRLKTKGFGKSKPVADNQTEEGRLLNRRVEFIILSK